MRGPLTLAASCLLGACPGGGESNPPLDAPPMIDGTVPSNGVTITFAAMDLPIDVTNKVTLESVTIRTMTIRALGDVASDDRTTLENAQLEWKSDGEPASITFDQAPTGMYSKVDLRITKFELRGTAESRGDDHDFEIEGESELIDSVVDVPDMSLESGGTVTFAVAVDLASICAGINWNAVRQLDDKLKLDDDDPQMPGVRTRVDAAFRP
ncbi:MAG: hypothetical protein WKG01_36615 [Kofleriaceae bacterium]